MDGYIPCFLRPRERLRARPSNSSYGAAPETDPYKNTADRDSPRILFILATRLVLKTCLPLVIILLHNFRLTWEGLKEAKPLIACSPQDIGSQRVLLCEYFRAAERCFPPLALVTTVMLANRQMMQLRIFYRLLRQSALLQIEDFPALCDPFFLLVIVSAGHGLCYFLLCIWVAGNQGHPGVDADAAPIGVPGPDLGPTVVTSLTSFIIPSMVFIIFLAQAHDTQAQLVPFTKVFEPDPERARRLVKEMQFVEEAAAAVAVQKDLCPPDKATELPPDPEIFKELVRYAVVRSHNAHSPSVPVPQRQKLPQLGVWRLAAPSWPSGLLLNGGLSDEDSRRFRAAWYGFSVLMAILLAAALTDLIMSLVGKCNDVGHMENSDWTAVVMTLVHIITALALVQAWVRTQLVRCLT